MYLEPSVKRALQRLAVLHPESSGFTLTQHTRWPTPNKILSFTVVSSADEGHSVGRELFLILDQRRLPEMLRVDLIHRLCHFLEVMCVIMCSQAGDTRQAFCFSDLATDLFAVFDKLGPPMLSGVEVFCRLYGSYRRRH